MTQTILCLQITANFVLFLILFFIIKKSKKNLEEDLVKVIYKHLKKLELFLHEAKKISEDFEEQLKEKKRYIRNLEINLDKKIKQIKEAAQETAQTTSSPSSLPDNLSDKTKYYNMLFDLYQKGESIDEISKKYKIPVNELELIIKLKE